MFESLIIYTKIFNMKPSRRFRTLRDEQSSIDGAPGASGKQSSLGRRRMQTIGAEIRAEKKSSIGQILRDFDRNVERILNSGRAVNYGEAMRNSSSRLMGIYLGRAESRVLREAWKILMS